MLAAPRIQRLTSLTAEDIECIGGKGCGLVRLLRAGFAVPDAWVIAAQEVPRGESELPAALAAEARELWRAILFEAPGARVAVRSSATAEDLEAQSFAGVYQTILNVDAEDTFLAAILQCRSALHSEQAEAYRRAHRIEGSPRIALVVQRMLDPEVAGVLMTSNPLRPLASELVIGAAYGLGEMVVSGRVEPDHLVVRKADGRVAAEAIGSKKLALVYRKGRMHEVHVAEDRRGKRSLSDAQVAQLCKLAGDVERSIGPRQDCEWAFAGDTLYVLQQRPMTGLPPENPSQVFSRKFGDEYIADYTLPLSYSVLMPWIGDTFLAEFSKKFGFAHRLTHPPTIRHEGYAYVSGEFVAQMMSAVPGALRRPEAIGWFPDAWNERVRREPFRPWQLLRMFWAALRDPHSSIRTNPRDLELHCANVATRLIPKLRQDYTRLSEAEWDMQFAEGLRLGEEHFFVIRWGMGFHNPLVHSLLQDRLEKWTRDGTALYQALISGLPGTKTAEVNKAIWVLATIAQEAPVLMALLEEGVDWVLVRAACPEARFWPRFDAFLEAYGHRGATRDIAFPRWAESPGVVFSLVRVQALSRAPDPEESERQSARRRKAAEGSIAAAVGKGIGAATKVALLKELTALAQTYTVYRENQRFYLDYVLAHLRGLVLEAGRRLHGRGVIEQPDDVFFLDKAEFLALRQGAAARVPLREKIHQRRAHYQKWRLRLPNAFLFDGVGVDEVAEKTNLRLPEGALAGMASSMGRASGRARVVLAIEELGTVLPGEILVANNTDPGWTSVFPLLAGLVTGTGGVLSHGALLAREYGIPAVTGVKGAVNKIRTGDVLELNALEGWVRIVEGAE